MFPNWTSITVNESPVYINNLEKEQSYELQIACNCLGNTRSEYSTTLSFETQNPHELTLQNGTVSDGRTELEEKITVGLQSYPNPTNGILFIEFYEEDAMNKIVTVYDMTGRSVFQKSLETQKGANRHEINLSEKVAGRYIVELSGTNQALKQSIILY
ncbi:MAG: T9SS type A sorting domain-containing protein [Chitinophagales bacterium]